MQEPKFFDAIFQPQAALKAWAKDPAHKVSLKPGMTWIVIFELIFGAILLGVSWGLMLVLRAAFPPDASPDHWAIQMYSKLPSALQFGGVVTELSSLAADVVVAVLVPLAAAAFVVLLLDKAGGAARRNQLYNVLAKMTVPWHIFFFIPVLGWIVMVVGIFVNSWRSLDHLFPGLDWTVRLRVFIAGSLAGILAAVILGYVLSALLSPILRLLA